MNKKLLFLKTSYLLLVFIILITNFKCASRNALFYENQDIFLPLMENGQSFYDTLSDYTFYIYVSPKINILEFFKTFDNTFGSGKALSDYLRTEFENKLELSFDTNHQVDIVDPLHALELSDDDDFYTELHETVLYNKMDYLIFIQSIEINNKYIYGPSVTLLIPSGEMMPGISGTESCTIEYEVQVIEVKTWEMVNNFMIGGSAGVAFLSYESALYDAIANSIENTMIYLKTGDPYYFE